MIIGLDLSLTHTGWAILNYNKTIDYGTIIPKKLKGAMRLSFIRNKLKKVIKKYKPVLAVIEGYAYSPNANMSFSIGENGGVVKLMLWANGIDCINVAPKTLKKFTTSNGNASKTQMAKAVKLKWKEEFKTDHEVDAYALAKMGYYILSGDYGNLNEKELEAIKTVESDVTKKNEKGRSK